MVSTNFDPDIYAEVENLQLFYTTADADINTDNNTTRWYVWLESNTANTFRDNFFSDRDSKIIETGKWSALPILNYIPN